MIELNVFEFSKRLRRISNEPDNKVVFFLGAGASITSGVPSAKSLSTKWLKELKSLQCNNDIAFEEWIKGTEKYSDYDSDNAGKFYSEVIKDLFPSEEERQKEIEKIVQNHDPAFGYAVLAKLMGEKYGNTFNKVLTTNFDDLVADALYLFSNRKPLVITHEALINYAKISSIKPTIIKLHGDAHLSPKNTEGEIQEIDPKITSVIASIIKESFLVFIGYGGNDKGILKLLSNVSGLNNKVYWVNNFVPANSFGDWLNQINALWVKHLDFDMLMLLLFKDFELNHPDSSRFEKMMDFYKNTFVKLSNSIDNSIPEASRTNFKEIWHEIDDELKRWQSYIKIAKRYHHIDVKKSHNIYMQAIKKFPNNDDLYYCFGLFLKNILKDNDEAFNVFNKLILLNDKFTNGYFERGKIFYENSKYIEALSDFNKSIELNPKDSWLYIERGRLYRRIERYDMAQSDFNKSIKLNPKNEFSFNERGILFLYLKDYKNALVDFNVALKLKPNFVYAMVNSGYALLSLYNHNEATKKFNKAIDNNPNFILAYIGLAESLLFLEQYVDSIKTSETILGKTKNEKDIVIANLLILINKIILKQNYSEIENKLTDLFDNTEINSGFIFDNILGWCCKNDEINISDKEKIKSWINRFVIKRRENFEKSLPKNI